MATFINHVTIAAPRNGTDSHTVDPSSGVAVAGTPFTPSAGNLLVCVVEGPVTSTTPSGWTLPGGGSAVNNTGLYVWYRTAAGGDVLSTTHNGIDRPVVFDFYEFPVDSVFLGAAAQGNVSGAGGAGPSLSGLTDTANFRAAAVGQNRALPSPVSFTWSNGVEAVDTSVSQAATDGYGYSLSFLEGETGSTYSSAATSTDTATTCERLVFAVSAAASGETHEISGVAAIISGAAGTPTAILGFDGSADVVSVAHGSFGAVFDVAGSAPIVSGAQGGFRIWTEDSLDSSGAFPLIERVVRAFIQARYPAIGSRVGGDAQYVLGQEPYIQIQQMPGGGATQLEGEWAVDIAVFDDNFVRAATIANELEDLFLRTRGARHEGMIIDTISQNQTPSKRPTADKRIFEVGTIYVFEARRRS